MPDDWGEEETRRAKAALIDTTVPNAARVTDYLYGGQNNFEADRKAARAMAATAPVIAAIAPAVRAFQQRVLRFLVAEAGIRQFLDVGTGLPSWAAPTRWRSPSCPSAASLTWTTTRWCCRTPGRC